MWIALLVFAALLGLLLLYIERNGGFGFPWVQFYVRGKEHGFRIRELNLLRKVAVENRLKNPTSLFWSERTLDRCIRGTIINFRANDKTEDESSIEFLNKLFDFRKRVEFNLPKYRLGIQSTRSIDAQQPLKITFPGGGVYTSKVVENMRKYLAVAYPRGKPLPFGVTWQGQKISVYFWRVDDAGYYFESRVIGDYMDRNYPILHITHSDQVVRTQKRNSVRASLETAGQVFPLRSIKQADETAEQSGGYRCRMVDISEDGAAVVVGGRAKPGLPVKIQTQVNDEHLIISGVIKGVNFRENKNVSVLHIEAVPPGPQMKNKILTYVYGIFSDSEKQSLLSRAAR
ncbi:MAG: flagellar brake protein [Spirochaetota bacterium]